MRTRSMAGLVSVLAFAAGVVFGAPAPAHSQVPQWAPAASASIHPGVMMFTDGAQCTANFVYTDAANVYLGYAAHCAALGDSMDTNGCTVESLPLGTPVEIVGATRPGTLAYSSWVAMQAARERDGNACNYNDLALVKVHPADVARVNPSVPHWGGPNGLKTTAAPAMSQLYSYGNSSLRMGVTVLSPKSGVSLGTEGGGWSHPAYTVTPGIPGDSGGAMLDASGRAGGVLSTITLWPLALSNNFTDLNHALHYMRTHGGPNATLAVGTEPFNGSQAPLDLGL